MKTTQTSIKNFVLERKRSYILLLIAFSLGILFAFFLDSGEVPEEEIKVYMQDFLSGVQSTGTDSAEIFKISMQHHVQFFLFMFLASTTVIGVPMVWGYVIWKGFSYGAVLSGLFRAIGGKTIGVFFCTILPHLIFSLPAYLILADVSVGNAYDLWMGKKDYKNSMIKILGFSLVFFVLSCMSAWVQAYGEPLFLSWIPRFNI